MEGGSKAGTCKGKYIRMKKERRKRTSSAQHDNGTYVITKTSNTMKIMSRMKIMLQPNPK